uniref:Homeobox domain-containing protein n=1 Tax=Lotus japonicus TaxID=34305 RepID=I3S1I7_LOTJA|nr:unknown [Lotus japonicus]
MGRPPSNGGPAFRFTQNEVAEMEAILQEHNNAMPARDVLAVLAEKFSESPDRKGKITVQMKQVWNWFQNKRYAIRAKSSKTPGKLNITPMPRDDSAPVRNMSQPIAAPILTGPGSVPTTAKVTPENSVMEFEAKSARDGAWYDVASFLSHRYLESSDPEVLYGLLVLDLKKMSGLMFEGMFGPALYHVNHLNVLQSSLEILYSVFRKVKSKLFTLTPMSLILKDEGMM